MAVVLKNQVVDQLRASRSADDAISRIQENSLEQQRKRLVSLVESPNWRFGPAELLATFPHHLVAKDPAGNVVQVEWSMNSETGKIATCKRPPRPDGPPPGKNDLPPPCASARQH